MPTPAERAERLIRRYFDRCNAGDHRAITECFAPDAVHYFPPGQPAAPWRGGHAIATGWLRIIEDLDARWSMETILCATDGRRAAVEWTIWKPAVEDALRGGEWYEIDVATERIREIRVYYAAPADASREAKELKGFDYRGRGFTVSPPERPRRG